MGRIDNNKNAHPFSISDVLENETPHREWREKNCRLGDAKKLIFFRDIRARPFYFHTHALRQAGDVWAGFWGEQLVRLPSLPQCAGVLPKATSTVRFSNQDDSEDG